VSVGPARVLSALRRAGGGVCSGEALSARYGISRAQVWKDVEALRARGYGIEGASGGGYRLARIPDRLYPEEILEGLATRWLARDLRWFDCIDSTNRAALELARAGAAHGTTLVAETQSAGRGRQGRSFFSPPHLNLYTSIVLRPETDTAEAPAWIMAAAAGVAEAIAAEVGDPAAVEIKWPNDVLLGGLKTCGILMELSAEATRVGHMVLGIGVNLNVDRADFPAEFRRHATSLSSHSGHRIDRVAFARRLYALLEDVLDRCAGGGLEAVRPRFEALFRMPGRRVSILEPGGGVLEGEVAGIDRDGALLLRRPDGSCERVLAGDVSLAKEPS
jgi:BirA family biotin operon repressor/biotin-[acetyl-CoA-carboxylase] ligase